MSRLKFPFLLKGDLEKEVNEKISPDQKKMQNFTNIKYGSFYFKGLFAKYQYFTICRMTLLNIFDITMINLHLIITYDSLF